jgi:hypothetical protein
MKPHISVYGIAGVLAALIPFLEIAGSAVSGPEVSAYD